MKLPAMLALAALALAIVAPPASGSYNPTLLDAPPRNQFLSDTPFFSTIHRQSYCQSSVFGAPCIGADLLGSASKAPEVGYVHGGSPILSLAHSLAYENSTQGVFWAASAGKILKIDVDTFQIIASLDRVMPDRATAPGGKSGNRRLLQQPQQSQQSQQRVRGWDEETARSAAEQIDQLLAANDLESAADVFEAALEAGGLGKEEEAISSFSPYSALSSANVFYIPTPRGVCAFGDTIPSAPRSKIVQRCATLPPSVEGLPAGLNILYSGHVVVVTTEGELLVFHPDLSKVVVAADLEGEVSNSLAVDSSNIAYVVTDEQLYAIDTARAAAEAGEVGPEFLVEDGKPAAFTDMFPEASEAGGDAPLVPELVSMVDTQAEAIKWASLYTSSPANETASKDQVAGAATNATNATDATNATAAFGVRLGKGSGSTPTIMGQPGEEFIVITDGAVPANLVVFFAGDIPGDFEQIEGSKSRRIAAQVPMPFPNAVSEQSVLVGGYGMVVVNNQLQTPLEGRGPLTSAMLSGAPSIVPKGIAKFTFDPKAIAITNSWTNEEVPSPNSIPSMCQESNLIYTISSYDGVWHVDMIDWDTGEVRASIPVAEKPSVFYNSLYSAAMPTKNAFFYGTPFGALKLAPQQGN